MTRTLDRMEKVFKEFLTLARPGDRAAERIDLAACARECVDLLEPRFEAAKVAAEVRAREPECWAWASAPAVKRAALNVLLNALQHAGEGGRVVAEVTRAGGKIRLDVSDTGPGIAAADREKVFEMFYTTRPQGTGLGLFLARTAVENNGGTLAVAESAGGGGRLRMELPQAEKENE